MLAVTNYGVPILVATVALQWWTRKDRPGSRHAFVAAGLAFLIGLGLNQIILLFVSRLRPYDAGLTHLLLSPTTDPSFPSDHSTAAFAIAASLLAHGMKRRGAAYLVAASVISFSRVFVGTHYVSDVFGGALIGCVVAVAIRHLYRRDTRVDRLVTSIL
jgi:undecaprenyl-diphosphatase